MAETIAAQRVPIVEGLFAETPEGPRLLGSKCEACGQHYFPRVPRCVNPRCRSASIAKVTLGPSGTLYSYTVQHYEPPPPVIFDKPFKPYAVGLVELSVGVRVAGMLKLDDLSSITIGMPLELVIDRMATNAEGKDVTTWKFAPAGGGQ